MALVLHHSKAKGTDKVILLGIANHSGDGGAWPSIATLARYANVEERAAQRAIHKLASMGEVVVHLQAGGTHTTKAWQRPNRYDVTLACPATCDGTAQHRMRALPDSPADLWIKGVSPTTPGVTHDTGGVSPTTPGGVSPTTPEPSYEPPTEDDGSETASLTTARDAQVTPVTRSLCAVCFQPEAECQRRSATSGHAFTPRVVGAHQTKRSNERVG